MSASITQGSSLQAIDDHIDAHMLIHTFRQSIDKVFKKSQAYDYVQVILCYWEESDTPHMSINAKKLESVFQQDYKYDTELFPLRGTDKGECSATLTSKLLKLANKLNKRVKSKDDNALLIVYYGGHVAFDAVTETGHWGPTSQMSKRKIDFSSIQVLLSAYSLDYLFLLDCCYAGGLVQMLDPDIEWKSRCEMLGACGVREKASAKPGNSFTVALTSELRSDSDFYNRRDSSAYSLMQRFRCKKMLEKYKLMQTPYFNNRQGQTYIPLTPLPTLAQKLQQKAGNLKELIKACNTGMLMYVRFKQQPNLHDLDTWATAIPKSVGTIDIASSIHHYDEVVVLGLFDSNSTLGLLYVPVWLWDAMPMHPAISSLHIVESRNRLPAILAEPQDERIQSRDFGTSLDKNRSLTVRPMIDDNKGS